MDSAEKITSLGATVTDVRVVTVIMIVLMSASQFYTQRQLMTKNVDLTVKTPFMQQQKMLMYVFPIMFAVFGINFPVGVLVYWLTTNVWTMGQQMFVIRRNPTPGSLAFQQRQERLRAKGKLKEDPAEVEAKKAAEAARASRQQPKRQPKAKRQAGTATQSGTEASAAKETSTARGAGRAKATGGVKAASQKQQPEDAKEKQAGDSSSRNAKSGQRKGQQRPQHPSKK
jgi:YidC/Oxa1 family membrane protein insertase